MLLLYLAFLLAALSGLLLWLAWRQRRTAGLPGGRVIYTDTRQWGKVEEPLYDAGLGLTGKPDYLVRQGKAIIPVEVKSGRLPQAPYDGHIYQLAAYCLLVQRVYGERPPYGILHYTSNQSGGANASRSYAINYTPELENSTRELLVEMHRDQRRRDLPRSHETPARCHRCGFREHCDQRLS